MKRIRINFAYPLEFQKSLLVIVDNARYHHSKETQKFIEDKAGEVLMAFLPAYSPELNPDEKVWNHAKAMMGKLRVRNKEDMFSNMKSILHSIQKKTALIKSFFKCSTPNIFWMHEHELRILMRRLIEIHTDLTTNVLIRAMRAQGF